MHGAASTPPALAAAETQASAYRYCRYERSSEAPRRRSKHSLHEHPRTIRVSHGIRQLLAVASGISLASRASVSEKQDLDRDRKAGVKGEYDDE